MKKPKVISMEEFQAICGLKSTYSGYVWDQNGLLFSVVTLDEMKKISQPSYPNQKNLGHSYGTVFYEKRNKSVTITLEEIGNNGLVYDEYGEFIEIKQVNDTEYKGQIYIRKKNFNPIFNVKLPWDTNDNKKSEYEYAKIQDLRGSLSPEAYSKIFTHIVSLKMKGDLQGLKNGQISIQFVTTGREKDELYYNMTANNRSISPGQVTAFYDDTANIVAAILQKGGDYEVYSTLWNVINLLGVHELGHKVFPWMYNGNDSHYLLYLLQMGHDTYENTTPFFKRHLDNNLNLYYGINRGKIEAGNKEAIKNINKLQNVGLYPTGNISGQDSIRFNERISRELQNRDRTQGRDPFPPRYDNNKK